MNIRYGFVVLSLVAGCTGGERDVAEGTAAQAVNGVPSTTDGARVPLDFLRGATPLRVDTEAGRHKAGLARASGGVPNVDSVVNFTSQFTAPGFDSADQPQSVWPFSMVGRAPQANQVTRIKSPIVPITVELLDADGHVGLSPNGSPLRMVVGQDTVDATVRSPVYGSFPYNSGTGQFTDQMMRTMFWDKFPHHADHAEHGDHDDDHDELHGYHVVLQPQVKATRTIQLAFGTYRYAPRADGSCCAFILADINEFGGKVFPATPDDTSTVLGSVENSGDATTKDITTLLFKDFFLYQGDPANCCILGFHSYDLEPGTPANGNREKRYVMNYSSYISPNLFSFGFQDITAFSHEMAELFADPFVDNATPWWLSQDPVLGSSLCQNNLETGDVTEVLNQPVHPIPMNGRTYHPSNEALLSWFAFQSPSTARAGAYSFPDETVLPGLSPGPLHAGCVP